MSTVHNTPQTLGEKLRSLREQRNMSLRNVASTVGVDVAVMSKMERGERKLSKEMVQKLAMLYDYNSDELVALYLSEKVVYEIEHEPMGLRALQLAEEHMRYTVFLQTDRNRLIRKLKTILGQFPAIEKAWIYGSFARKDDGPLSDIDLAITAGKLFSYFDMADIQYRAEQALGRKIDIGFIDSFKPEILKNVQSDLRLIYEKKQTL